MDGSINAHVLPAFLETISLQELFAAIHIESVPVVVKGQVKIRSAVVVHVAPRSPLNFLRNLKTHGFLDRRKRPIAIIPEEQGIGLSRLFLFGPDK
jgi:hypothetical protein